MGVDVDLIVEADGAVDVIAPLLEYVDVDDNGGAQVHGAVEDNVIVNLNVIV